MTKEERIKKSLQLKFLAKSKIALNFQIQGLAFDKTSTDDEKDIQFAQLLEKLNATEIKTTELKRNKFNSSAYEFNPFIGLNRKQRRNR